jgi:hypothetical protein
MSSLVDDRNRALLNYILRDFITSDSHEFTSDRTEPGRHPITGTFSSFKEVGEERSGKGLALLKKSPRSGHAFTAAAVMLHRPSQKVLKNNRRVSVPTGIILPAPLSSTSATEKARRPTRKGEGCAPPNARGPTGHKGIYKKFNRRNEFLSYEVHQDAQGTIKRSYIGHAKTIEAALALKSKHYAKMIALGEDRLRLEAGGVVVQQLTDTSAAHVAHSNGAVEDGEEEGEPEDRIETPRREGASTTYPARFDIDGDSDEECESKEKRDRKTTASFRFVDLNESDSE